jgi:hypothetical protein
VDDAVEVAEGALQAPEHRQPDEPRRRVPLIDREVPPQRIVASDRNARRTNTCNLVRVCVD